MVLDCLPENIMTPSLIWTLRDVTLAGRFRPRLDSISCEISTGITAVVGDSGAGKSSLLNLLVGFEKPTEGQLTWHLPAIANTLPVFWIPPGNGLWSHLTVRQHLETVHPGMTPASTAIDELLDQFDLRQLERALPNSLSQGEQARLSISRALASHAAVLVLDEPLVHTSLLRQRTYWESVRAHCMQHHISIVLATHDLETIAREADSLVILSAGKSVFSGAANSAELAISDPTAAELWDRISRTRAQVEKTEHLFKQNT